MNIRVIGICMFLACTGANATTADNYAFAWPLQTDGDSAAWQVELTPEIYAAARRDDLLDVEVVNAAGDAVPMAQRAAQTTTTAQATDFELPQFALPATTPGASADESLNLHIERGPDGKLRRLDAEVGAMDAKAAVSGDLLFDASALKAPIDSVWLDWNENADVNAQFSVSGSDDLQQWRTLNANASVLSLHQGGNVLARHQIGMSGAQSKYLRLHRLDTAAGIDGLRARARTLARSTLIQPARMWVDAAPGIVDPPTADAPATFRYQLPAQLTIDTLKIDLTSDNSLARVRVAVRGRAAGERSPWSPCADFTAFRLRQGDASIGNDEITSCRGMRALHLKLLPSTGLDHAPSVRVAFRPDRFVFLAQGAGPYRLVAGSARSHRGDYPVDAALAQLRAKLGADWQPPLAALGTRAVLQGESAFTPAPPEVHRDWKTWLLWAVLVGAAALIGGLALSLLRGERR